MERVQLLQRLDNEVAYLTGLVGIDACIFEHYKVLLSHYRSRPFFYKSILKYDRLMVVLAMLTHFHTEEYPSLSKVREFCERRGYLSKNSLESYFLFFSTAGYMDVHEHPEDRRLRVYRPSGVAMNEARKIIESYYCPVMNLRYGNAGGAPEAVTPEFLRVFFSGFYQFLDSNLTLADLMPETRWIMNKDGGHMLMLALYVDAWENHSVLGGYKISTYAELSSALSVSSSHLIRLVKEGAKLGYFKIFRDMVGVTDRFMAMVRRAMVIAFAITLVSERSGREWETQ